FNRGSLALTNSTVSGNQGIGVQISNSGAVVRSCTIADNAGVGLSGAATIMNTILAGNNGGRCDCTGSPTSAGYNVLQNVGPCGPGGSRNNVPGQNSQIGPRGDDGGRTKTHAIALGRPALDAGNPGVPGSGGLACEATDQQGTARPQPAGGRCDI